MGEAVARLEFSNNDLGFYYYDLNLKATSAGPERALYFRTCLGQSQVQVAKFLNFAKQKTDYACKVSVHLLALFITGLSKLHDIFMPEHTMYEAI